MVPNNDVKDGNKLLYSILVFFKINLNDRIRYAICLNGDGESDIICNFIPFKDSCF